jgi:hypothetical protein
MDKDTRGFVIDLLIIAGFVCVGLYLLLKVGYLFDQAVELGLINL